MQTLMKASRRWLWLLSLLFVLVAAFLVFQPRERITLSYSLTVTNQWGAKTMCFRMTNATRQDLTFSPRVMWVDEKMGNCWYDRSQDGYSFSPDRMFVLKAGQARSVNVDGVAYLPYWRIRLHIESPRRVASWRVRLGALIGRWLPSWAKVIAPSQFKVEVLGPEMIHGYPAD